MRKMTHDKLFDEISVQLVHLPPYALGGPALYLQALRAVVQLHKPDDKGGCAGCPPDREYFYESMEEWPCPTIQAIEKELGE
jgi:hypothetical protein